MYRRYKEHSDDVANNSSYPLAISSISLLIWWQIVVGLDIVYCLRAENETSNWNQL